MCIKARSARQGQAEGWKRWPLPRLDGSEIILTDGGTYNVPGMKRSKMCVSLTSIIICLPYVFLYNTWFVFHHRYCLDLSHPPGSLGAIHHRAWKVVQNNALAAHLKQKHPGRQSHPRLQVVQKSAEYRDAASCIMGPSRARDTMKRLTSSWLISSLYEYHLDNYLVWAVNRFLFTVPFPR